MMVQTTLLQEQPLQHLCHPALAHGLMKAGCGHHCPAAAWPQAPASALFLSEKTTQDFQVSHFFDIMVALSPPGGHCHTSNITASRPLMIRGGEAGPGGIECSKSFTALEDLQNSNT